MTRPVRLLVFCGATGWGGAEIVLGHLLAALPERFETSLVGVDEAVLRRVAAARPGTGWQVVPRVRGRRDLAALRAQRLAMSLMRPDVLHVNLPVPAADAYSVLAALTLRRTRVVLVAHLPAPVRSPRTRRIAGFGARRASAVVGVSSGAARRLEEILGLAGGSVRVVPNGVPAPAPGPVPAPRERPLIGAVGRLDRQKGFDVLLRALADVPDADLAILGEGRERPALEHLAGEMGVRSRVSMPGWREDAAAQLGAFDVLVLPSRNEGLPLVLLEAMLAGVPVVATAVGGIPDAVRDGESGLLVPPDDAAALAAALRSLTGDPALRRRLAAAAAREGRRYTAAAMADSYARVYDEVLAPRSSRRRRG